MPAYITAQNALNGGSFVKDTRIAQRPLPPPGNALDGSATDPETGIFPAVQQVSVITLGGSTATGNISTLTITPTRTASGSAWADGIPALVITVTTGVTETLTALGELVEARALAILQLSSLTDTSDWQPLADFLETITAASGVITVTTRDAGARFDVAWTSDGLATASTSSTGTTDDELVVGTAVVVTGYTVQYQKKIAAPVAGSVATAIMGIVAEGIGCKPATAGYAHKVFSAGSAVPVHMKGRVTGYAEAAVTVDSQVYVRKTATGTEIAGALNDAAILDTPQVWTLTPTAANSTLFSFEIVVRNHFTGALVAQGEIFMTSDADATATEIVTGWKTSLADDNDQLDSLVTGTGTTTLILTIASPNVAVISPNSPGVIAGYTTPSTAGLSDFLIWTGAKFIETTAAAGIAPLQIPTP